MLITEEGYTLAPLYDLVSTIIYPELKQRLAMKVGGEDRPEWLLKRHWEQLSRDAGVASRATLGYCEEMAETLPSLTDRLANEFIPQYDGSKIVGQISEHIKKMSRRMLESIDYKS